MTLTFKHKKTRDRHDVFWYCIEPMARLARVVIVDVAHHVTQRGNGRQFILASDAERMVYLDLLRQAVRGARVVGGGLLPDVEPRACGGDPAPGGGAGGGLPSGAWALRRVLECCPRLQRARVAGAILFLPDGPGPLVDGAALCGTESGARGNGGGGGGVAVVERRRALRNGRSRRLPGNVDVAPTVVRGAWRKFLEEGETEAELRAIRRATHSGRPLGPAEFVQRLESSTQRRLRPQKGGRPRKTASKGNPARQKPH